MNKIDLIDQNIGLEYNTESIEKFVLAVLEKLEIGNWEFSIVFCDDEYMKELNSTYRGKDESTDILTFSEADSDWDLPEEENAAEGGDYAGDIAVSVPMLKKNSEYFKVDETEELKRLLIHGILHLSGMDHDTNNDDEEMIIYQEKILKDFGDFTF